MVSFIPLSKNDRGLWRQILDWGSTVVTVLESLRIACRKYQNSGVSLLWEPLREHIGLLIISLSLLLSAVALSLVQAGALRAVFDGLQGHHPLTVRDGIIAFAGAVLGSASLPALSNYTRQALGSAVMMSVRERVVSHLLRSTLEFHDAHLSGDITSRISTDVWAAYQLTAWDFLALIANPLMVVASAVYLWTMSPTLALVIIPIGPLMFVVRNFWKRRLYDRHMQVQVIAAQMNQSTLQLLQGMVQIKALQVESGIAQQYDDRLRNSLEASRRDYGAQAQFGWITGWIGILPFIAVVTIGSALVARGQFELGTLIASIQLMNRIVLPFGLISQHVGHIQNGVASMDRIKALMDAPIESAEDAQADPVLMDAPVKSAEDVDANLGLPAHSGPEIRCARVQFGYESDTLVLRDLSLTFKPGQLTAVVGPNGGGKSTLVKLLLRLYMPATGRILWNGQPFEALGTAWIRKHTVYVPQDTFFIHETVRENLRLVSPAASDQDLLRVLDNVGLLNPFADLDRLVGEAGRELSGGQRLRLSIARALLRDGPFWIMDEPMAALDPIGVRTIAGTIRELAGTRTIIVVTHSHEIADLADQVWLVQGGEAIQVKS
jgi:ATP-binding cassette subfamily B protein